METQRFTLDIPEFVLNRFNAVKDELFITRPQLINILFSDSYKDVDLMISKIKSARVTCLRTKETEKKVRLFIELPTPTLEKIDLVAKQLKLGRSHLFIFLFSDDDRIVDYIIDKIKEAGRQLSPPLLTLGDND